MILQALTEHYEDLVRQNIIAPPGWAPAKINYALYLDAGGAIYNVAPTTVEHKYYDKKGNEKSRTEPASIPLPAPVKRTVGLASNFLWDNSSYILGVDNKDKPLRTGQSFELCRKLHTEILSAVRSPCSEAICSFFKNWDPKEARNNPVFSEYAEEILSGNANITFRFEGDYVVNYPEIRKAWNDYYNSAEEDTESKTICLVTGKRGSVESVHPSVKGVRGAQSAGAAIVSFNAPAFCSYGKEQSYNAPVSKYAAFAYTSALNYMLSDHRHLEYIGDTAVTAWAKNGGVSGQDLFFDAIFGNENVGQHYTWEELQEKLKQIVNGKVVEYNDSLVDPEMTFYVLGIAPNGGRLSVRFFLKNTFGKFIRNAVEHQERLKIGYNPRPVSIWSLSNETVNKNSRDKSASPVMTGELLRAVLGNTMYPATLLNGVNLRIRAEHDINDKKAAVIKAYYLKNTNPFVPKEVLQVSLNPDAKSTAYQLGRMFSVLEEIQSAANPGINSTIKDKYFNSASATPAAIFPILINLAQKHLRKLNAAKKGYAVALDKKLADIMDRLGEGYPIRMNLPEQGAFQLGYYHQTQERYRSKTKEEQ